MEATINDFYSHSSNYGGASLFSSWLPRFNQSQIATSVSESKPTPIRVSVGNQMLPGWLQRALKEIEGILKLEPNWDSYGARAIDQQTAIASLTLLSRIMKEGIPEPSIVPVSTGGIQLEWHKDGKHVEIELLSPTEVSFFFEDEENAQETEDEGKLSALEPRIRDLLSQVFL